MFQRPFPLRLAVLSGALALLAACNGNDEDNAPVVTIGAQAELLESGLRLTDSGRMVRAATAEGLVGFDAEGRVVPALADRWIVTDDGLSYIFRLREGITAGGAPMTGEKARDSLKQALAMLKGTALALDLDGISEVRAMTGRVVEVRLSHPMPDLLDLLAQPEMALLDRGRGVGPFTVQKQNGKVIFRPVPPERRGLPENSKWKGSVLSLGLTAMRAEKAAKSFSDKDTDLVLGGDMSDYAVSRPVSGISQRFLRVDPVAGLFGLAIVSSDGILAKPDLREALAMAIDREALATVLTIPGWTPTTRIIPPAVTDAPAGIGERWAGLDMATRRSTASQRLVKWTKGGNAPVLRLALSEGPGADALYTQLEADLGAVGIKTRRVALDAPADLRLIDNVARYGRADWYLNQLACAAGRTLCSTAADLRAADARAATHPAERAEFLTDAEALLTLANTYIPLGNPVRWSLVRDPQPGFMINARGYHPLSPLAERPR